MAKVNVYIPDALLEQVDAEAAGLLRSRSFVVQEAVTEYLSESKRAQREEKRRADMAEALAIVDRLLATPPGPTDIPDISMTEFIRGLRDADDDATDDEIIDLIRSRRPTGGRYVG